LAAAIAGLALLPALWWLDAIPWSSDRLARVVSDLRESVDAGRGRSSSEPERDRVGSATAPPSSAAPSAPSESSPVESRPTPPSASQTARVETVEPRPPAPAASSSSVAVVPPPPAPPATQAERTVSPPAQVPPPPAKPEVPRRSPTPDSRLAESQRPAPGVPAGSSPSGA